MAEILLKSIKCINPMFHDSGSDSEKVGWLERMSSIKKLSVKNVISRESSQKQNAITRGTADTTSSSEVMSELNTIESGVESESNTTSQYAIEITKFDDNNGTVDVRTMVAREILTTEETYVGYMRFVNDCYFEAWLETSVRLQSDDSSTAKSMLKFPTPEVISSCFPKNFKAIYNFNVVLCQRLKELVVNNNGYGIGTLFNKYGSFLKMYTEYSANFDKAMRTYQKVVVEYPCLSSSIEKSKSDNKIMHSFEDLMIMPVQRAPRYGLLLNQLLKNTSKDHEDYPDLQVAVTFVQKIVNYINESVRKKERSDWFETLMQRYPQLNKLIAPTRYLIYDAVIKSRENRNLNSLNVFLFNDVLVTVKESLLKSGNVDISSHRHVWPLNLVWFSEGGVSYSIIGPNDVRIVLEKLPGTNREFFTKVSEAVRSCVSSDGVALEERVGKFSLDDEEYEGGWLNGHKHGEGVFKCSEYEYDGGFKSGKFSGFGKLRYLDGCVYEGEWSDSLQNGHGKLYDVLGNELYNGEWLDGCWSGMGSLNCIGGGKYVGEFKWNSFHNQGELTFPDGSMYSGGWKFNRFDGVGHFLHVSGLSYQGEFLNGYRHGSGKQTYSDDSTYVGNFFNGKKSGCGCLTLINNLTYQGDWIDNFPNGHGTLTFPDGRKYVGAFAMGQFNGQGLLVYPDGVQYEGSWSDNMRHGKGTLTFSKQSYYSGEWAYNKMDGRGNIVFESNAKYEGYWQENQFHKTGTFTGSDGDFIQSYEGDWELGRFSGKGSLTLITNESYKGSFKNGTLHGHGVWTYANGLTVTGKWNLGKRVGKFTLQSDTLLKNSIQCSTDSKSPNILSTTYSDVNIHLPPTPPILWFPPDVSFLDAW